MWPQWKIPQHRRGCCDLDPLNWVLGVAGMTPTAKKPLLGWWILKHTSDKWFWATSPSKPVRFSGEISKESPWKWKFPSTLRVFGRAAWPQRGLLRFHLNFQAGSSLWDGIHCGGSMKTKSLILPNQWWVGVISPSPCPKCFLLKSFLPRGCFRSSSGVVSV